MELLETEPAEGGQIKKWLLGYIVPGAIAAYAIWALFSGEIHRPKRFGGTSYEGAAAYSLACTYLSFALWQHFHWGWGLSHRLWPHVAKGKRLAWGLFFPSIVIFAFVTLRSAS